MAPVTKRPGNGWLWAIPIALAVIAVEADVRLAVGGLGSRTRGRGAHRA